MTGEEQKIVEWLSGSDTGVSSKALAFAFLGETYFRARFAPADPADLGRCLRLIRLVPQVREMVDELAGYGHKEWERLAPHWDELTALFESEKGHPLGKAPKTYQRMQEIRRGEV